MLFTFILLFPFASATFVEVPVPKRPVGFTYGYSNDSAHITFDFYIDLLCSDSKEAFPTILQVAEHYGPDVLKLTAHLFPLPYHKHAFLAAKCAHIVQKVRGGLMPWRWFQTIFDKQGWFSDSATHRLSERQVERMFGSIALRFGLSWASFLYNLDNNDIETNTRIGWKYTCTRGIAWTPAFLINDVFVRAEPSWNLTDWRKIIDPLIEDRSNAV